MNVSAQLSLKSSLLSSTVQHHQRCQCNHQHSTFYHQSTYHPHFNTINIIIISIQMIKSSIKLFYLPHPQIIDYCIHPRFRRQWFHFKQELVAEIQWWVQSLSTLGFVEQHSRLFSSGLQRERDKYLIVFFLEKVLVNYKRSDYESSTAERKRSWEILKVLC